MEKFGWALLVDVHGQGHREGVTELGYLLTSKQLLSSDAELRGEFTLGCLLPPPLSSPGFPTLPSLARGTHSLGALLEARGEPCTPSPARPAPCTAGALEAAERAGGDTRGKAGPPEEEVRGGTYFWGGYSIRRYCLPPTVPPEHSPLVGLDAEWATRVAGVQAEVCWEARESPEARSRFGKAMAEALSEFLESNGGKWEKEKEIEKEESERGKGEGGTSAIGGREAGRRPTGMEPLAS